MYNNELVRLIGSKIPTALQYAFNRHADSLNLEKSGLEKLGDFLLSEARLAVSGGVFDFDENDSMISQRSDSSKRFVRNTKSGNVYAVAQASGSKDGERKHASYNDNTFKCVLCNRKKHRLSECVHFAREPLEKRWALVKSNRLCFNCLKSGHAQNNCRNAKCSFCKKGHHDLLHRSRNPIDQSTSRISISADENLSGDKTKSDRVNVASDQHDSEI